MRPAKPTSTSPGINLQLTPVLLVQKTRRGKVPLGVNWQNVSPHGRSRHPAPLLAPSSGQAVLNRDGKSRRGYGIIGLALAMPTAWSWMRLIKNSWMRIDAFDGSVYAISALFLLIVSLSAMGLPAYRATEVDPIQALRDE